MKDKRSKRPKGIGLYQLEYLVIKMLIPDTSDIHI